MSIYKFEVDYLVISDSDSHGSKTDTELNLKIFHMQCDNQVPTKAWNKIIFGPLKELSFDELDNHEEEYTPFIQIKIETEDRNNG